MPSQFKPFNCRSDFIQCWVSCINWKYFHSICEYFHMMLLVLVCYGSRWSVLSSVSLHHFLLSEVTHLSLLYVDFVGDIINCFHISFIDFCFGFGCFSSHCYLSFFHFLFHVFVFSAMMLQSYSFDPPRSCAIYLVSQCFSHWISRCLRLSTPALICFLGRWSCVLFHCTCYWIPAYDSLHLVLKRGHCICFSRMQTDVFVREHRCCYSMVVYATEWDKLFHIVDIFSFDFCNEVDYQESFIMTFCQWPLETVHKLIFFVFSVWIVGGAYTCIIVVLIYLNQNRAAIILSLIYVHSWVDLGASFGNSSTVTVFVVVSPFVCLSCLIPSLCIY